MQGPAGGVERIALAAPVPAGVLLDTAPAVIERVASEADGVAMERAILALAGERDGIRIEITGGMNRPPMPRSEANVDPSATVVVVLPTPPLRLSIAIR